MLYYLSKESEYFFFLCILDTHGSKLHPLSQPPISLKPRYTAGGMLMTPTQTPGVLRVGCFNSFIHCYNRRVWFGSPPGSKEMAIEADLWGCLLCLAAARWARVSRDTLSLDWASLDCMNGQTDWSPGALNSTLCVTLSMSMFLLGGEWEAAKIGENGRDYLKLLLLLQWLFTAARWSLGDWVNVNCSVC